MSELKIPEAAYTAGANAYDDADPDSGWSEAIDAAAPLIVAAELRQWTALLHERALYEEGAGEQYGIRSVAHQLEYRIDKLDPQGLTKQ